MNTSQPLHYIKATIASQQLIQVTRRHNLLYDAHLLCSEETFEMTFANDIVQARFETHMRAPKYK